MTAARKWLVLSYFSRIDGMAAAQHVDDRIPFLRMRGVTPIMITSMCGGRWREVPHLRVPCVAPSGVRFELRHLRRRSRVAKWLALLAQPVLIPLYLAEKAFCDLDSQWSWFPLAIACGVVMCRRERPEVIYATGGAPSAHLAAYCISRLTGTPWISEFQDPLVHGDWQRSALARKVFGWLERLVCRRAAGVIFLTEAACRNAQGRTALGSRGHTVYAGADPAAMPEVPYQRGEVCRFTHFGSFGGSRNIRVFLDGLKGALEARPELASVVRLDLYGTCDPLSRRLIEAFPHPGIVTDFGRVPRSESLVAMKKCDVLLLIQNTEEFSVESIPSKTYEYFHTGRPVLGLVFRNPELEGMLRERGDMAAAADDPREVREGILALAARWEEGTLSGSQRPSPYTVRHAVDRIVELAAPLHQGKGQGSRR